MGPSLTGRTVVIKDETGEIPCGRMFSVQKWVRAPGLPPLSSMVVFKFLLLFLVNLHFGCTHIWISLVALIGFTWWLSLDFSHWISLASFGQFSGNWIFSDNEV